MGIVATGWIEGLSSEVIYLTRAIFILRRISQDTIRAVKSGSLPPEVIDSFLDSTKRYHRDYIAKLRRNLTDTIWTEAEELSKYLLDFEAYDLLQILREGPKQTEHLPSLLETTKAKLRKKLKTMEKAGILVRVNDEDGKEHALLKSSPEVVTVYPEWLIQRTVDLYNQEEIHSRQAGHYLEILKKFHPSAVSSTMMELE
jgi:DNA-binding HxlR family transcriptional regulator